ncbi:MAG: M20 family metallopeptidase [Tissierellia bacterium]|nr:M20 family metallopeptidase [Tissierellia bacterium]
MQTFKERALELLPELKELSQYIYDNPELGYEEFLSSKAHIDMLEKYGFEMELSPLDMETAYVARYRGDKPGITMAYLAEYDALPGIGHGCGHNILGATALGAALVLKDYVKEKGGTLVLFGTPAEETSGAKVAFADHGYFKDVDVAICPHPSDYYFSSGKSLALAPIEFTFKGKTAHAASEPQAGINALDALLLTFNNVNALREHILPSARVHGIVKEGGLAANIVPEKSVGEFYVRTMTLDYMEELLEKVINCAKAGALATGCTMEYRDYEARYHNMVTNQTLSDHYDGLLEEMGVEVTPPRESFGSLDMGNVSQVCPSINPYFGISDHPIPGHTVEFRDATLTDLAMEGMINTIVAMVKAMVDCNEDPALLAAVKEEFENRKR